MRASTQSVMYTSKSCSMVLTVSRRSVEWWPDSGATISTRLPGSGMSLRKCSRWQNGFLSTASMLTGTGALADLNLVNAPVRLVVRAHQPLQQLAAGGDVPADGSVGERAVGVAEQPVAGVHPGHQRRGDGLLELVQARRASGYRTSVSVPVSSGCESDFPTSRPGAAALLDAEGTARLPGSTVTSWARRAGTVISVSLARQARARHTWQPQTPPGGNERRSGRGLRCGAGGEEAAAVHAAAGSSPGTAGGRRPDPCRPCRSTPAAAAPRARASLSRSTRYMSFSDSENPLNRSACSENGVQHAQAVQGRAEPMHARELVLVLVQQAVDHHPVRQRRARPRRTAARRCRRGRAGRRRSGARPGAESLAHGVHAEGVAADVGGDVGAAVPAAIRHHEQVLALPGCPGSPSASNAPSSLRCWNTIG